MWDHYARASTFSPFLQPRTTVGAGVTVAPTHRLCRLISILWYLGSLSVSSTALIPSKQMDDIEGNIDPCTLDDPPYASVRLFSQF